MNIPRRKTTEELKKEFLDAKEGIDNASTERVMYGLPLHENIEYSEEIRTLRQVWSRYRERIQHGT